MCADVCLCDDQSGQRGFRRVRTLSCGTTEAPQYPAVIWIIGPENYLLNERRSEWTDGQMEEVAGIRKQCMLVQVHELAGALCLSMEGQGVTFRGAPDKSAVSVAAQACLHREREWAEIAVL